MVAFFQRHISAWMDGTESLDDGEYRVYDVLCNLIYLNDGPVVFNERGFAGRCGQHVLKFRKNFQKLVERQKLILQPDGKVTNKRVMSELEKIGGRRPKPPANPRPTSGQPPANLGSTSAQPPPGRACKPLKNKQPDLLGDPLYNIREEKKEKIPLAYANAPTRAQQERELFDRGKQVLGHSAGGMITTLLKSRQYDVALARAVIETASTKQSPREYVAAAIRNGSSNGGGNRGSRSGSALDALDRVFGTDESTAHQTGGEDSAQRIPNGQLR